MLGETKIPAIVVDASEADCLVMSLVENVARRQHRPIDIMHEIGSLSKRGYSDAEIGGKIGLSPAYVAMIVVLLERGEERLVAAVETGLIPSASPLISHERTMQMSKMCSWTLMQPDRSRARNYRSFGACSTRGLRGGRRFQTRLGLRNPARKITAADLMRIYQRELKNSAC